MAQKEKERNIKRERDAAFAAESAQTRMITPCKVVQMRETVSTAPRSTLLLYLDIVMLETACERWGVCRRALACGSERGACLYLARALLLVCVGVSVHACALSFPDA